MMACSIENSDPVKATSMFRLGGKPITFSRLDMRMAIQCLAGNDSLLRVGVDPEGQDRSRRVTGLLM